MKADGADRDVLAGGEYARKHLFGSNPVLRWSHTARFRTAVDLLRGHAKGDLLDWGCGDGTLVALVHDRFPRSVGVEVDPALVATGTERFGGLPGVGFATVEDAAALPDGSFGTAVCTEVLEHCTEATTEDALSSIHRLLAPGGTLVVSVPVETGPSLVGKQLVRAVAAWRGPEGYRDRERYSAAELLRALAPGDEPPFPRPVYRGDAGGRPFDYHGHKGFNWKWLRRRLEERFDVRRTRFSPLPPLGALLNSQAWLVCERR